MGQVGKVLSQAIKEGRWILINYTNKQDEKTTYWISIQDIYQSPKENNLCLKVHMYNLSMSDKTISGPIYFSRIERATLLPFTDYEVPKALIQKLENSPESFPELEYDSYSNSILNYYIECRNLDNDPSRKEGDLLPGIDIDLLLKERKIKLNQEQEKVLNKEIIEKYGKEKQKGLSDYYLAITDSAIARGGRVFIVCYHELTFNPENKTLSINPDLTFNTTFLCRYFPDPNSKKEKKTDKFSLQSYVDMDLKEFMETYKSDKEAGLQIIREGLRKGESLLDTRPEISIIERPFTVNLNPTYSEIDREYRERVLPYPVRAFFGNISRSVYNHARKEPYLVIYDAKTNIDQILALYNALKYPVTYVQGPPGTGKTQTLVNVMLSAYFNGRKVLMSSSNNRPVDAIISKLSFRYRSDSIPFPWLRLGNNDEMLKALDRIKTLASIQTQRRPDDSKLEILFKDHNSKIRALLDLLQRYERRQSLEESGKLLNRFLQKAELTPEVKTFAEKKLNELRNEYKSIPEVKNEDAIELCNPVSQDDRFLQYLYYDSLKHILKLKSPRYKGLLEIAFDPDRDRGVRSFNAWLSEDKNLELLNDAFPIIFCTNISSQKLGTGKYKFDLTVIDEAGQCNVADALLPIARGRNLLLLGDESQLRPVILLDEITDENLRNKYRIDSTYSYTKNSILSVMRAHDSISKFVFLSYHYRCGKKIIEFSNERFYNGNIKPRSPVGDGEILLVDIDNANAGTSEQYRNSCYEEARSIVDLVKRERMENVSILCPFRNQVELINELLQREGIDRVRAGTIHTMQGAENDVVILSTAISDRTKPRTFQWLKNNSELVNVATTRSRKKLIVYADVEAFKRLAKDRKDDLSQLIKYAMKNGGITVDKNERYTAQIGYSNNSPFEAEFWKTMSHLCSVYAEYTARRNVPEKDVFKDVESDVSMNGEFDLVLYERRVPVMAFEVDGPEHFSDPEVMRRDRKKRELCQKMGLKLFVIDNRDVKDYDMIVSLIQSYSAEMRQRKE